MSGIILNAGSSYYKGESIFGFEYQGTKDVDWLSAEPIDREAGIRVIHRMFPDQLSVPYVPTLFRASNPPAEVGLLSCPTALVESFISDH